MYHLSLSRDERRAIDWIGHRYFHGTELYRLLWIYCTIQGFESGEESPDWYEFTGKITFIVPENVAWQIRDSIESEGYSLACFANDLKAKLLNFCDSIV